MQTLDEAFNAAYAELTADPTPVEAPAPDVDDTPDPDLEPEAETEEAEDAEPDVTEPEGDEEEDEPTDESQAGEVLELPDGVTVRLPDGTEVDSGELRNGYLRQSDYTRKTQEVAEQRREAEALKAEADDLLDRMANWYEDRSSNPANWIEEVASQSDNPTVAIARALKNMADKGLLDPDFVETFGLKAGKVADTAAKGESDDRLATIERELAQQREAAQQVQAREEAARQVLQQWEDVKTTNGLSYTDPAEEHTARAELLRFAVDHELADLKTAYLALEGQRALTRKTEAPPAPLSDPAAVERKRATRAMAKRSAAPAAPVTKPTNLSVTEAASEALEEFLAGRA